MGRVSLLHKYYYHLDNLWKFGRAHICGRPHRFFPNAISGESICHARQLWGFAHSQGRTSAETLNLQAMQTCTTNHRCREFHATGINCARDYYEILGLNRGATQLEIKKAYYALAKVHHPDMNKGDTDSEKKFQEIQKAYEALKDDEKRAIYDQAGPDGYEQTGSNGGGGPGFNDSGFGFPFSDLNEMWSQFTKGNFDFETPENVEVPFQISFMESVKGCNKKLQFNASMRCSGCKGAGAPPGAKSQICKACRGCGSTSFGKGFLSIETTCSTCGGEGRIVKEKCKTCKGVGTVPKLKELEVDFPPGVKSGDVIRLTGEGGAGPRGHAPGDLFVKLEVLPDPVFRRQGLDIHVDSSISFTQAILGGTVQVPTLTGHAVLKVLPGTQPGQKLCLRGKGIKAPHKGPGKQVVNLCIEMPTNLSRRQRLIIEELAREESEVEIPAAAATG